jgi:hypothetical protein
MAVDNQKQAGGGNLHRGVCRSGGWIPRQLTMQSRLCMFLLKIKGLRERTLWLRSGVDGY